MVASRCSRRGRTKAWANGLRARPLYRPSVQKYSILKSCGSQQSKFDVANYILQQVMNWTPQSIIWIRNSCAEFNLPIRVWTGTLKMWYLRKKSHHVSAKNRLAPQWFLVDQELSEDWKYLGINQSIISKNIYVRNHSPKRNWLSFVLGLGDRNFYAVWPHHVALRSAEAAPDLVPNAKWSQTLTPRTKIFATRKRLATNSLRKRGSSHRA